VAMVFTTDTDRLGKFHDLNIELPQRVADLKKEGGPASLEKALNTNPSNGIMPASHDERKNSFGENVFPEPDMKTFLELCMEALEDTTMIILCIAAAVSMLIGVIKGYPDNIMGELYEGLAIFAAVVVVTLVTAVNEDAKEKQFQELNREKETTNSIVIRGGVERRVLTSEILVGDVVKLVIGDKIPADGIMFDGFGVRADEASLTGEAETVRKEATGNAFLYSGCLLAEGTAHMYVTAVGPKSQWGIIKEHLSERDEEQTPLQEKLEEVAELIGKVGLGVAIACFVVLTISWIAAGNYQYKELVEEGSWKALLDFLVIAVTIVAVAVPEGLPLAVTISLAYSMKKMMKDNNLVRHLQACETMGSATMICSDKTGTLTQNKMTVVEGVMCGDRFTVDNGIPTIDNPISPKALQFFHFAASQNSTASVKEMPDKTKELVGNATECAVLKLSMILGGDNNLGGNVRQDYSPFNSADKSSKCIVTTADGQIILFRTGAPERVIDDCSKSLDTRMGEKKMDAKHYNDVVVGMAKKGLRTVGLAYRVITPTEAKAGIAEIRADGLTMLSVLGLKDPVRPEVPNAVHLCKRAGIVVRMVTGDNVETAQFIAKECGILEEGDGKIAMIGPEFAKLSDNQIKDLVDPKKGGQLRVLARSSPSDKLRLVKLLKELNEVVAVTGDGTNDAPALKEANVGLAMNIAGTEVAKDASDIVILDDNFRSIVSAVKWGRSVFDNIRKFIQFQLTINFVALILAFFSAVFCAFFPPEETEFTKASFDTDKCTPLNAIQLLWINLIMDSMGALALATEEPEDSLLDRAPVGKTEGLISSLMWRNIAVQGVYQLIVLFGILFKGEMFFSGEGYELPKGEAFFQSRPHYTILFNAFVWCQIFNEFNSRRLDNEPSAFRGVLSSPIFIGVIVATIAVQYAFVEFGGEYTKTVPLTQRDWLATVAIGSVTIPIGFITRLLAGGASAPKGKSE
jgi:Ca2+-transporting ATPase